MHSVDTTFLASDTFFTLFIQVQQERNEEEVHIERHSPRSYSPLGFHPRNPYLPEQPSSSIDSSRVLEFGSHFEPAHGAFMDGAPFFHGAPFPHVEYLNEVMMQTWQCVYQDYLFFYADMFNRGEDVFDYARARRYTPVEPPSPER